VCRRLRASASTRQAPLVVITAHDRVAGDALAAGADRVVMKPFDLDALCSLLHELVERRASAAP